MATPKSSQTTSSSSSKWSTLNRSHNRRSSSNDHQLNQQHLCPICGGRFTQSLDLAVHLTKIHCIKAELVDADLHPANSYNNNNNNNCRPDEDQSSDDTAPNIGLSCSGSAAAAGNGTGVVGLGIMTSATSSSAMIIQRLRSAGGGAELDLKPSPALSVQWSPKRTKLSDLANPNLIVLSRNNSRGTRSVVWLVSDPDRPDQTTREENRKVRLCRKPETINHVQVAE